MLPKGAAEALKGRKAVPSLGPMHFPTHCGITLPVIVSRDLPREGAPGLLGLGSKMYFTTKTHQLHLPTDVDQAVLGFQRKQLLFSQIT